VFVGFSITVDGELAERPVQPRVLEEDVHDVGVVPPLRVRPLVVSEPTAPFSNLSVTALKSGQSISVSTCCVAAQYTSVTSPAR
jgi:hypothetical protein